MVIGYFTTKINQKKSVEPIESIDLSVDLPVDLSVVILTDEILSHNKFSDTLCTLFNSFIW